MPVPMVGEMTVLQYLLNSPTKHLKVRLGKNPLPADLGPIALADLVQCDFDGYAQIVDPPFEAAIINENGYAEGLSFPLIWTAGPAIVPQTVRSMYVVLQDGAGPDSLLWVGRTGLGYDMTLAGQTFGRKIRLMVADRAV